jgi:2-dehydropantoate 2-reductase
MRMLVVGAGSIGGYFGGRLAQAGRDVTFLVRPARAARLEADGLQIVSPHGSAKIHPQFVTADQLKDCYDIVLLSVKAFSLTAALDDMAPAISAATMILPVLNGMKHVEILGGRFGKNTVMGCACKAAVSVDELGRVVQLSTLQDIAYGEMDGSISARGRDLDAFMNGAGFDARLSQNIAREMWEKWVLLATLGSATCLMRGTIGDIVAANGGRQFISQLLDEVVAVVTAAGVPPDATFLSDTRTMLTANGSTMTSSMYRDLQKGAPIEAEQIVGDMLARARYVRIATPLIDAAYTHLCIYQNRKTEIG